MLDTELPHIRPGSSQRSALESSGLLGAIPAPTVSSHGDFHVTEGSPPPARSRSSFRAACNVCLGAVAAVAFLFFFHNYGMGVFPSVRRRMDAGKIRLLEPGKLAYGYEFAASEPDVPSTFNWRSRIRLTEDGRELEDHRLIVAEVFLVGGGRWAYQPGRVVFSASDNSDPRVNGRKYEIASPLFYRRDFGRISAFTLLLSLGCLYWLNRRKFSVGPRPSFPWARMPEGRRWHGHLSGATFLFLCGLYCNTGTLAPYAITTFPHADPVTGYLYNPDHIHFKVLSAFVGGAPRAVWDHALLLRRILFPVLCLPLTRLFGFEIGGTLTGLLLNAAAFVVFVCWLRRRVGSRGAIFAAWLLALSPGAAYWAGLPYPYALIFPGSLLLMACLVEFGEGAPLRTIVALSLAMGLLYLGYDFAPFFLPATIVVLAARRRLGALALALPLQLLPVALWSLALKLIFHQRLENSNSGVYHAVLSSYSAAGGWQQWRTILSQAIDAGGHVFFGANFIFLPALFLILLILNPFTSRLRFLPAETALLLSASALFLLNNLSRPYGGWDMHGTWIARIYQPVFPAFVVFAARWWQHLPKVLWPARALIGCVLLLTFVGDGLIVFGPIAFNPLGISEFAYYNFYNHSDTHWVYELNLRQHGRRPLAWPRIFPSRGN